MKEGVIMIRSNLAVILAENNLKITKVAHDTGISRTTLTALSQNNCKGIQFDTLNTLCMYLNISVSELILFTPINIDKATYYCEEVNDSNCSSTGLLYFDIITNNSKKIPCSFKVNMKYNLQHTLLSNGIHDNSLLIEIDIHDIHDDETIVAIPLLKKLNRSFINDITTLVGSCIYRDAFKTEPSANDVTIEVYWTVFHKYDHSES